MVKNKSHIKYGRVQHPEKPQPTQPPIPKSPCEGCEHLRKGKVSVEKGKSVTIFKCEKYEKKINCPKIEVTA